jgi:integrase
MPVRVPVLGRHSATGQARVRINGRDFYLGPYGSAEAEEKYRRLIAEWLSTDRTPAPPTAPPQHSLTINELVLAYWRHAEVWYRKGGKPTPELTVLKTPLKYLRRLYGSTPAAEFGPLKLKAVRDEFVRLDHCRYTINKNVGRIRRMFAWAVENELVPPSVDHGLRAVSGLRRGRTSARETAPVRPVDESAVNAILPHVSRQVRDMIRLQLLAGCRPGEIVALRPCDIKHGDVWEYLPASHKTEHHGRERRIFFGPRAQAILAAYLDNRPAEARCFSPAEAEADRLAARHANRKTPLSCGNRPGTNRRSRPERPPGNEYTVASYRRAIERGCKAAKIPPWSPNRLRHSRATDLRRQFGIEAAQTVLGHAELAVTQVYAERDFAAARRIMAEVG